MRGWKVGVWALNYWGPKLERDLIWKGGPQTTDYTNILRNKPDEKQWRIKSIFCNNVSQKAVSYLLTYQGWMMTCPAALEAIFVQSLLKTDLYLEQKRSLNGSYLLIFLIYAIFLISLHWKNTATRSFSSAAFFYFSTFFFFSSLRSSTSSRIFLPSRDPWNCLTIIGFESYYMLRKLLKLRYCLQNSFIGHPAKPFKQLKSK